MKPVGYSVFGNQVYAYDAASPVNITPQSVSGYGGGPDRQPIPIGYAQQYGAIDTFHRRGAVPDGIRYIGDPNEYVGSRGGTIVHGSGGGGRPFGALPFYPPMPIGRPGRPLVLTARAQYYPPVAIGRAVPYSGFGSPDGLLGFG